MNELLEAALEYVAMGYCVIPIKPDYNEEEQKFDKDPYIKWKPYQTKKSTPGEIKTWWGRWPNAMIGIITGALSKVFVIDCDTEEAYQYIQGQLPDSFITPIDVTPRGGKHLWFLSNGSRIINDANVMPDVMPHIDCRGDGGYIVTAPSINAHGQKYEWLPGLTLKEVAPQEPPYILLKKFIYIEGCSKPVVNDTTQGNIHYKILQEGHRDQDLFKIGMALADGHCQVWMLKQILDILALNSNPPFPPDEVEIKIKSVIERLERKERNLADEVREWILLQNGNFSTTQILQTLHITTKEEKKNLTVILSRLCNKEKIIEPFGDNRGNYRTKTIDKTPMDLITDDDVQDVDIALPIELNDMCIISPGNIIVVAGSKSSGKTALMMNAAWDNQNNFEIVYLNSEMHPTEFKKRMKKFAPLNKWKITGYQCHNNFEDFIDGDRKKIFFVDYLEVHDNFYEIAKPIRKIHEKLGDSICFIGVQMKAGASLGRGGDFSAEKARLYLTMDFNIDEKMTKVTIYDAKEPKPPYDNVRGKWRRIKIINGHSLDPKGNWSW